MGGFKAGFLFMHLMVFWDGLIDWCGGAMVVINILKEEGSFCTLFFDRLV